MQKRSPQKTATLDQDATLVETAKRDALFSYKGFKSYQPLNTWWAEQQMVLHTEFRDGNVPAGHEQLRVFSEEAHSMMKGDWGRKVAVRGFWRECHLVVWIMILAMNLNTIMKRLVLGGSWVSRRIKAIRFSFINIPGRIVERSRELIIRLVKGHPALDLYLETRRRILGMIPAPG